MTALRIGLCALVAFTVLAFGAVQVWSSSILEIAAGVLLIIWAILFYLDPQAGVRWNPLNWPLLAFLTIGVLQLVFGATAYSFLTHLEVLRVGAYLIVFFLAAQAFQKRADFSVLAWFLILFCFGVSLLAVIQHFTSEKEIYWMSSLNIQGDSFGPFVNRNHFAGFVELTLPIGLGLIVFRGVRREIFPLLGVLTIVPVSALILSGSRGGIIGFGFELCVLATLAKLSGGSSEGPRVMAVGIVAFAALALVMWVGARKAIERFSVLPSQDLSLSRRVSMSRGGLRIFFDHPIKGTGLGTMVSVYPRYETIYDGLVVEHIHDDFIEELAETGIVGGLCGLAFLWLLYRIAQRNLIRDDSHFGRGLRAGAIVGVSGILLHSFIDFNLHIPSNALLFLIACFIATSESFTSDTKTPQRSTRNRTFSSVVS